MPKTEFTVIKDDDLDDDEGLASSWTGRRIYKNLLIISSSFLFVFTAFQALSNLQSSINCDEGLGLASLSVIYGTLIVSAMFVPSVMIRHLGLKWTLVVSQVTYALYTAANFYPSWATLIPASVILGLGAAPLWTAKSTYLTTTAGVYSKLTETGDDNGTYCDPPETSLTYTLLSIYLVSGIIAVIIVVVFVDNLGASKKIKDQGTLDLFFATARLMKDKKMIAIIPLTIFSGLEQAFIAGDFTKSYVTCSLGVGWVGYVMICYGLADAICSVLIGRLVKYTGQIPFFCLGALINVSLIVALFVWEPFSDQLPVFFVIAALWGVGDAIWQTQLNSLYGILFRDQQEQAFSNYRLWESVGFTMAFAYSNFLCVWIKLTILVCALGVGMLGYASAEFLARREG
ncbi:protein unc-93 homolog A-like isoform X4 [Lytechinus pictus]